MDASEERRKKLEAGKEKLAAFRKKKAKSKKAVDGKGKDYSNSNNGGHLPLDMLNYGDMSDSDSYSLTSGDEYSTEETEDKSSVYYKAKLAHAQDRITQLEETVEGKQLALDALITETQTLKNESEQNSLMHPPPAQLERRDSEEQDIGVALAQRDSLISNLTESLQYISSISAPNVELLDQIQALGHHVVALQAQLRQANEELEQQLHLRESSSLALQTAKTQIMQLQRIVNMKEAEMKNLMEKGPDTDTCFKEMARQLSDRTAECEQLRELRQQAQAKEEALISDLHSKSTQIETLMQSEQFLRQQDSQWRLTCETLQRQLQDKDNSISMEQSQKCLQLETELTQLQMLCEKDQSEISALKVKNSELKEVSVQYSQCLSSYESLCSQHKQLKAEHSDCLAQLDDLRRLNTELQDELDSNQTVNEDLIDLKMELDNLRRICKKEAEEKASIEKLYSELESQFSLDSDRLNNKVNELQVQICELQAEVQTSQAVLTQEKEIVCELKEQLDRQNTELQDRNDAIHRIHDYITRSSLVQLDDTYVVDAVNGEIEALELKVTELVKKLRVTESQNQQLSENISSLQDRLMSDSAQYQSQIAGLNDQLSQTVTQLESASSENAQLSQELISLREQLQNKNDSMATSLGEIEKVAEMQTIPLQQEQLLLNAPEVSVGQTVTESVSVDVTPMSSNAITQSSGRNEAVTQLSSYFDNPCTYFKSTETRENQVFVSASTTERTESVQTQGVYQSAETQGVYQSAWTQEAYQGAQTQEVYQGTQTQEVYQGTQTQEVYQGAQTQEAYQSAENQRRINEWTQYVSYLQSQISAYQIEVNDLKVKLSLTESSGDDHSNKEMLMSQLSTLQSQLAEKETHQQQLLENETALHKSLEELQSQLESTVSQWQKLQFIVQEKEIEVHKLQDSLEEEKRISSTQRKIFESEKQTLSEELANLNSQWNDSSAQVFSLESELSVLKEALKTGETKTEDLTQLVANKDAELESKTSTREVFVEDEENRLEEELKGIIGDRDAEISSLKEHILNCENQIGVIQNQIDVAGRNVTQLTNELSETKERLAETNNQLMLKDGALEQKEAEMKTLKKELLSRDSEIEVLKIQNLEKDSELQQVTLLKAEQDTAAINKEEKIQDLESQLSDVTKQYEELQKAMLEKETVFEGLTKNEGERLSDIRQLCEELQNSLQEKETMIDRLTKDLFIQTETSESLSKALNERQDEIKEKERQENELRNLLDVRGEEMIAITSSLSEKDKWIEGMGSELVKKDVEITELRNAISLQEQRTNEVNIILEDKESQLSTLSNEIAEKDREIEKLKEMITRQNEEFGSLQLMLSEKERKETDLSSEIAKLESQVKELKKSDDSFAELQSEINRLKSGETELKQEVSTLRLDLEEKSKSVQQLEENIGLKTQELSDLVGDNDRKLMSVTDILSQKELELKAREEDKENLDAQLTKLQEVLNAKDSQCTELLIRINGIESQSSELTSLVSNQQVQLREFQEVIVQKEAEVNQLKCALQPKDEHLLELEKQLKEKDERLSELQERQLKDRDEQLSDLHRQLKERDEQLKERDEQLKERDEQLKERDEQLKDRDEHLKERDKHLHERDEQLKERDEQLKERDEQLKERDEQLKERDEQLHERDEQLKERDEQLKERDEQLEERDEQLKERDEQLKERDEQLMERDEKLKERDEQVKERDEQLKERDEQLKERDEQRSESQGQLREMDEQLSKLQDQHNAKDGQLSEFQGLLRERDEQLSELQKQLKSKDEQLSELQGQLNAKDEQLSELQGQLNVKDEQLSELQGQLNIKDEQLSELQGQLNANDKQLSELQGQLTEVLQQSGLMERSINDSRSAADSLEETLAELRSTLNIKQTAIEELENSISDLKASISEKDAELISANQAVSEKCTSLLEMEKEIREKDMILETLKMKNESNEATLVELDKQLREKDSSLQMTISEMEESNAKLKELDNKIHEREESLNSLREALESTRASLEEQIKEKESITEGLKSEYEAQSTKLSNVVLEWESLVSEKDGEIRKLRACLDDSESLSVNLIEAYKERDTLRRLISEKDTQIEDLETKISLTNAELSELESALFSQLSEQALKHKLDIDMQKLCEDLRSKLDEDQIEISSLQKFLTDKESELENAIESHKTQLDEALLQTETLTKQLNTEREEKLKLMELLERKEIEVSKVESFQTSIEQLKLESQEEKELLVKQVNDLTIKMQERDAANEDLGLIYNNLMMSYDQVMKNFESEKALSSVQIEEIDQRESTLFSLQQSIELKQDEINRLSETVSQHEHHIRELEVVNGQLQSQIDSLSLECNQVTGEREELRVKIAELEKTLEQGESNELKFVVETKQLEERMNLLSSEAETKTASLNDLQHDCDMYLKEISDLKQEIVDKDSLCAALKEKTSALDVSLQRSIEEKEMLKVNFDSCMEEMQQKVTDQEAEIKTLKCQLTEETRSVSEGHDQMKELYEHQMTVMEEKITTLEKECERLEQELKKSKSNLVSSKEEFEHQLSDHEINYQIAQSEVLKLRDQLSKVTSNHECAIAGLKRLYEIQTNELEENCMALERTVSELKRQINEDALKRRREKNELEQGFENQLSEVEEKRRFAEMEISRLRKHLDEMQHDHRKEVESIEKSYESRLYELEDKYCIAQSELDRARKSLMCAEGDFSGEKQSMEVRLTELEEIRRELELKNLALQDEVSVLKAARESREQEMKSVLQHAATTQKDTNREMTAEINSLKAQLANLTTSHEAQLKTLQLEYEQHSEELTSANKQLESKVHMLEQHVQEDLLLASNEMIDRAGLASLEARISALNEENSALRHQISEQSQLIAKLQLKSGVEDICPPVEKGGTSLHLNMPVLSDCFSPTTENPVMEGFVAELSERSPSVEPDFVAERNEGFQPDTITEQVFTSTGQLNIHPIRDENIKEGFQPETPDLFFAETQEEVRTPFSTLHHPTLGLSPSSSFDQPKDEPDTNRNQPITPSTSGLLQTQNTECVDVNNEQESVTVSEMEKKVQSVKEELEEKYVTKMRQQEVELTYKFNTEQEQYKKEMDQHFEQKVKAVGYEWERKFTKALQRVRKEMEKQHKRELTLVRLGQSMKAASQSLEQQMSSQDADAKSREEGEPGSEELVKLHRENQELAEVRDALLKQIEISQARGLHSMVQHELQSMLTNRETSPSQTSDTVTSGVVSGSADMEGSTLPQEDEQDGELIQETSLDEAEDTVFLRSEMSDTASAQDRFLEELEEISAQSSQDLPLEWELTTTVPTPDGLGPEQATSVWEVFDGRCLRQDCQELDTLRIQYEHQVSSLQRQLEAERRNNAQEKEDRQKSYDKLLSDLKNRLDKEQQQTLDEAISNLTQVHLAEIQSLDSKHQNEVCLELTALKLSLEQIYTSKSEMEKADLALLHQQKMEEMRTRLDKQYKEQLNSLRAEKSQDGSELFSSSSVTEQYNQLIQRISKELEETFGVDTGGNGADQKVPSLPTSEIRNLLLSQQEEIASLRSSVLGEYEKLLQTRAESVKEQTEEMVDLEQQMTQLQKQFEQQIQTFQDRLREKDEEQSSVTEERQRLEKEQEEFKSTYEKRILEMEENFEREVSAIKEKYEEQISGLVHARLSDFSDGKSTTPREDLRPAAIAVSDTDSDSYDTPRSVPMEYSLQLKQLEADLASRDAQIKELSAKLDQEQSKISSFDVEVAYLRKQVEELQEEASSALIQCSKLQQQLEEKESLIQQLEMDKMETQKLYKDLLEKESPRSKDSGVKGHLSSSSVDDSFCSAKDDIQDTPRSGISDTAEFHSLHPLGGDGQFIVEETFEPNDSIPFANDSSEYSKGNNNNNNTKSSSPDSLDEMVQSLRVKVEELDRQLSEAREVELRLRTQLEEKEHSHQQVLESVRLELEHEKQMEVETLQSEFKIQMEIELKRQAAELSLGQSALANGKGSQVSSDSVSESDQIQSANTDALSSPLHNGGSQTPSAVEYNSDESDDNMNNSLLQTAAFEPQQMLGAAVERLQQSSDTQENLSDDFKVTTSSVTSLSSPPPEGVDAEDIVPETVVNTLPLTDIEKEMEALKEEYEGKLSDLKSQLEKAEQDKTELEKQLSESEERYDRLMQGVQDGEHPELNQLMKDKYDEELELAKSLMQKDFNEALKEEQKKYMERHRKLMADFMGDRGKEEEELKTKHEEELKQIQQEYEQKIQSLEHEIDRLKRDVDLFRDMSQDSGDKEEFRTLSEVDEVTFALQEQAQATMLSTGDDRNTSTPVKRPESADVGIQYDESEEELEGHTGSTLQIRSFADVLKSPSPAQYQQEMRNKDLKIQQLVAQVERLTQQLGERESNQFGSMSPRRSPQHSPQNDTLKGEDSALVAMLQSDLDRISAERESVQRTNDRLLSLLSDTVKTYVGVEDTINHRLSRVVAHTPRPGTGPGAQADSPAGSRAASVEPVFRPDPLGRSGSPAVGRAGSPAVGRAGSPAVGRAGSPAVGRAGSPAVFDKKGASPPDADTSQDSHTMNDTSLLSNATDEGLEISQRMAESIFVGPDLDADGEEILTDARSRLHTAVGQLLELMERSTLQLMEAKSTQQELLDTLAARAREVETARQRGIELDSQLASEIEAKEYLGLELHKAEGLISGYRSERESLEAQLQGLEEQRESLIVQLDTTRSRLEEFERSQSEMDSARSELTRQQTLLQENAGQETQVGEQEASPQDSTPQQPALLAEVSSLNQEKRELSNQLQHQLDLSRRRLTEMEAAAEEAERRQELALEERNKQLEDLRLQLENAERQLKASKAFVDEQMAEREQEREEHQKEIEKLQKIIEGKEKAASLQQRLQREIADLQEQLQSRMASQSDMHQRTVDLQKALDDKELNANDLKIWVAQLESELDQRGDVEDQLKQRINKLERQLTEKSDEKEEDETEMEIETLKAEKKQETRNIPPQLSPVRREPRLSMVSLEDELQSPPTPNEDLVHENQVLKEQVQQQLLQISGLKNQLDQMRTYSGNEEDSDVTQLRVKLQTERDNVENKEAQVSELQVKVEVLIKQLKAKAQEAESIQEKVSQILEMGDAQEENATLKVQLEELQSQLASASSSQLQQHSLPAELLEEKNQEIEELKSNEAEYKEKVRSLEQQLKEKDEEISDLQDNITSLRQGEPYLDVSLPMADEATNVLNISMTGRTSRSARAVTPTSIQQEFEDNLVERESELVQLREQLEHAQQELEQVRQEKEALQEKQQQNQTDQEKEVASLEESVQKKEAEIYELTLELTEQKQQVEDGAEIKLKLENLLQEKQKELEQTQEDRDKIQEQLHEKEDRLDQMILQIDSLQAEISSLTSFQHELQKDFDTVQTMLDEKEKDIESLSKELTDTKTQPETLETVLQLERLVASLQKDLKEKQNVVDEKEEELYELHDKLEEMENAKEELEVVQTQLSEALNALEKEKAIKQELENTLGSEKAALEDSVEKEKQLRLEVESSLEKEQANAQQLRQKKEEQESAAKSQIQNLEETVQKTVEQLRELEELKGRHESEIEELKQKLETAKREAEEKVARLEDEIKTKTAVTASSENSKDLANEIEKLTKQVGEKEALQKQLEDLVTEKETAIKMVHEQMKDNINQLEEVILNLSKKDKEIEEKDQALEEKEKEIEVKAKDVQDKEKVIEEKDQEIELKDKVIAEKEKALAEKDKLLEDLNSVRQQLEETEEQLRCRQATLLDLQAEKEQMAASLSEIESLKKQVEEKEQTISEVEGQLRFRQSALLDLEAEKDKLVEEHQQAEEKLKEELEKKQSELEEAKRKLKEFKEGLNEEVSSMEQELQRSTGTQVTSKPPENDQVEKGMLEELQTKYKEASRELADRTKQLEMLQGRLSQTDLQLSEREEQIHQLQTEVQRLQVETDQPQIHSLEMEMKIEDLEKQLTEAEERAKKAALNAAELAELKSALELQVSKLKDGDIDAVKVDEIDFSENNANSGLHHGEAVTINSLLLRISEVEQDCQNKQRELEWKSEELERLRADMDQWLDEDKKDQEELNKEIREKEKTISSLKREIESLKDELHSLSHTYDRDLDEKDKIISELQEQINFLKPSPVSTSSPIKSRHSNASLSPETKEQISHLKLQLRKAQAALEEMQMRSGGSTSASASRVDNVEELREKLRSQNERMEQLESDHQYQLEVKMRELRAQHDEDLKELRQLQERKLEQALNEQRQRLEKEYKTEINQLKIAHEKELEQLRNQELESILADDESTTSEEDAMPQRLQALLRRLNQLGEDLVSVSDLRYLQQYLSPSGRRRSQTETELTWGNERRALLDTIDALKDLHEQADRVTTARGSEDLGDWRSDLIQAMVSVYDKEKRVLSAEIHTSDSMFPEMDIITQLESRIHDLEQVHHNGLDEMLRSDRQSLLDEVDGLHHRLLEARSQLQDAKDQLSQRIAALEEAKASAEWKLQRQIQMLEYKLQQEGVIQEDLKKSLKLERQRVSELSAQSSLERSQTLELQSELSSTQISLSKVKDALEREQHRFSSVTLDWSYTIDALEEERAKTNRLSELLDSAKHQLATAQEEAASTEARHNERVGSEQEYIKELQSELKKERARSTKYSEAEEKVKGENVRLSEEVATLERRLFSVQEEYEARIDTLRRQHTEHDLRQQMNEESEAVSRLSELLDAERSSHQAHLDHERSLVRQLKQDLDELRAENHSIREQNEMERSRSDRSDLSQREEQLTSHRQMRILERDREDLRQKVSELEEQLSQVVDRTHELESELIRARQQNGASQVSGAASHREAVSSLISASVVDQELKMRLGHCCNKLQSLASQLHTMKTNSSQRARPGTAEDSTLRSVMVELNTLKAELREKENSHTEQNGSSINLGDHSELLQHNHQLAEHIVRLKKEKAQLAASLRTLENQLQSNIEKKTKMNLPAYISDGASDEEGVYDRTVWASEKLSLQMALDSAEHEIQRLRSEIKQFRGLLNSDDNLGRTDVEKSQRLYGKYLRAESFRKALIYQKKYLLLLLGGYRDTEQETLAILASMGGFPSPNAGLYHRRIHTRAFTVFRSAGRVIIAIFRMKYLVRKWKRATRVGSPVLMGQISSQHSYVPPTTAAFTLPPRQVLALSSSTITTTTTTSHGSSDYVESLTNGGDYSSVTGGTTAAMYGSAQAARQSNYSTPPTKELTKQKSVSRGNRDEARRRILQENESSRSSRQAQSRRSESEDDNFLNYLENVQQQLSEGEYGSSGSSRRVTWR